MKYFWLLFSLLGALIHGDGLEFSLNRNSQDLPADRSVCGILFCQVKAHIAERAQVSSLIMDNFSTITSLTIFQNMPTSSGDNDAGRLSQLATVKTKKPRFQQVIDRFKGLGHLEPGYAMLRLLLRKDVDCESEFTCQVEGLDADGNERIGAARLVQQPKEKFTDEKEKEITAWTPAAVKMLTLLQTVKLKTEQLENSQEKLVERMNNLQTRFEDKVSAGFQIIEDKIYDLKSKACTAGGGSAITSVKTMSHFETNQTLYKILHATNRLEGTLNNKINSFLSFITNTTSDQTCDQVLKFLAENITAEINGFSGDREDLVQTVEKHLAGLTNNFTTILLSLEESLNESLSMVPDFPPELFKALADHFETKTNLSIECIKDGRTDSSAVIEIKPSEDSVLNVSYICDTATRGGGWIIIQRRSEGDTDFYRDWDDYKKGFGTLETDFWLGNDNIHALTNKGVWELYIEVEFDGVRKYEIYQNFSIADEGSKYELHVGSYAGTAGDSLSRHSGHPFTTRDRDNYSLGSRNCAEAFEGAWWYINCHDSNLNGRWMSDEDHHGLMWRSLTSSKSATFSEMKIRKVAL